MDPSGLVPESSSLPRMPFRTLRREASWSSNQYPHASSWNGMKWICHPSPFSQEPWKAGPVYSPLPSPPTPRPSLSWAAWKLTNSPRIPCALASGWDHPKGLHWQKIKREKKREARCFFSISSRTQDLITRRDISLPSCSSCQGPIHQDPGLQEAPDT